MKTANFYLNFNGNTEEAFRFYQSVFGGDITTLVRFKEFGEEAMTIPEQDLDKIAHIALPLGDGNILMGTDSLESLGHNLKVGNNVYISLNAESEAEAKELFNALSQGGSVEMALNKTKWADLYGMCTDSFGMQWVVSYTGKAEPYGA